ncbi:phosphatidylserine decarboxylase proenzyme, mitochondrial-like [Penaeus chinensis]|uniref:phosphatidylserine decarboxylase proenzyme, mitochondrial-like n=1 Tax=Penaeus chinensis TaxID=139456 RepID=UPI001FB58301|nr:phosphatidylserine decarboxylase proenzyme, mitochondrial-like [Penaeus chinensis]
MASARVRIPDFKRFKLLIFWSAIILAFAVFLEQTIMAQSNLRNYLRSLRWTPLPVGVGLALIAFQQYRHTRKREAAKLGQLQPCDCLAEEWEVAAYKLLPLRSFSRAWGWVNGIELPEWSRKSVLGFYVRAFGCNMAEAEVEDLNRYACLSDLFRRSLKEGIRPVDLSAEVVSPADGTVLSFGTVDCGSLDQIKGVTYPLRKFLGPNCWTKGGPMIVDSKTDDGCFHRSCLNDSNNMLYHCVIYLAPGDYHRFHSSADWQVHFRRHFPGELLSVNPSIAAWVRDLFILNERVAYVGRWKHGFFSMTAVGATNVGSVKVYFDDELKTNLNKWQKDNFFDKHFKGKSIDLSRGGNFGEFNLGSTIVLVFEAPKDTKLCVEAGQKVKVGQALFRIINSYVGKASSEINHPGPQR